VRCQQQRRSKQAEWDSQMPRWSNPETTLQQDPTSFLKQRSNANLATMSALVLAEFCFLLPKKDLPLVHEALFFLEQQSVVLAELRSLNGVRRQSRHHVFANLSFQKLFRLWLHLRLAKPTFHSLALSGVGFFCCKTGSSSCECGEGTCSGHMLWRAGARCTTRQQGSVRLHRLRLFSLVKQVDVVRLMVSAFPLRMQALLAFLADWLCVLFSVKKGRKFIQWEHFFCNTVSGFLTERFLRKPTFLSHAQHWHQSSNCENVQTQPICSESMSFAEASHHQPRLLHLTRCCFRQCLFLIFV
jgi:hypothetical protein